jgi:hypothetical protein
MAHVFPFFIFHFFLSIKRRTKVSNLILRQERRNVAQRATPTQARSAQPILEAAQKSGAIFSLFRPFRRAISAAPQPMGWHVLLLAAPHAVSLLLLHQRIGGGYVRVTGDGSPGSN